METQGLRRTLSKVKTDHDRPETDRIYYFLCWFDPQVKIEEEFHEVRKYFDTFEVDCDFHPGHDTASIVGRGTFADRNQIDVEWIRAYFLAHGWREEEE
jgi:hypothetical protein